MTTPRDAKQPATSTVFGAASAAGAAASPSGVPAGNVATGGGSTSGLDSRGATAGDASGKPDRSGLMLKHREARARREAAPLGSDAYRVASEEVTAIEVAIAELEEPPPSATAPAAAASA